MPLLGVGYVGGIDQFPTLTFLTLRTTGGHGPAPCAPLIYASEQHATEDLKKKAREKSMHGIMQDYVRPEAAISMVTLLHIEYVFLDRMLFDCAQYARYALHCAQCAFKLHCFEPVNRRWDRVKNIKLAVYNHCWFDSFEEVKFSLKFQCIVNGFRKIASYNTEFNATLNWCNPVSVACFVNRKRVFDAKVHLPAARGKKRCAAWTGRSPDGEWYLTM